MHKGKSLKDSPVTLLLLTGGFLGLTFPLGKLASEASVSPLVWAWMISAGAGLVLLIIQILSHRKVPLGRHYLRFYLLSSICSLVLPNILIFNVIPKLGSGFTAILFTLTPLMTLTLSSLWQVRVPNFLGTAGIAIGFIGAIVVTLTRGEINQPVSFIWVFAGLCIPVSLAVGNLYRTLGWPEGAQPFELAIGSNSVAAIILFVIVLVFSEPSAFQSLLSIKTLALVQVIGSAAMFSVFFRLQQAGGPTYLSQIGYIAAGIALCAGTLFLGERYSIVTWFGAAVIVVGIGISVVAQKQQSD